MTTKTTTTTTTVVVEVDDETPEEEVNPYPGELPVRATEIHYLTGSSSEEGTCTLCKRVVPVKGDFDYKEVDYKEGYKWYTKPHGCCMGLNQRVDAYRDARVKKSERYETTGDVLRKTSELGMNFPFRDKLVTFLSVSPHAVSVVKQAKNLTQKRWMVTNLDKEVQILACWPGEWSQDVFEIDNRDYAKSILDLTESQFKARGRYRNV